MEWLWAVLSFVGSARRKNNTLITTLFTGQKLRFLPVSLNVPPSASLRGERGSWAVTPDFPFAPLRGEPGVRDRCPSGTAQLPRYTILPTAIHTIPLWSKSFLCRCCRGLAHIIFSWTRLTQFNYKVTGQTYWEVYWIRAERCEGTTVNFPSL